jgi:hypothetical protein
MAIEMTSGWGVLQVFKSSSYKDDLDKAQSELFMSMYTWNLTLASPTLSSVTEMESRLLEMYRHLVKDPEADISDEVRGDASLELIRLVLAMYRFRDDWLQEKVKKYKARSADEFQLALYEKQLEHLHTWDDVATLRLAVSTADGKGVSDEMVGNELLLVGKLRRCVWDQNSIWAMEKSKTVGRTFDLSKDLHSDRLFAEQLGLLSIPPTSLTAAQLERIVARAEETAAKRSRDELKALSTAQVAGRIVPLTKAHFTTY